MSDGRLLKNCSFDLHKGEVLALAGLVGSGRTELARLIFGADKRSAGTMELDGKPISIGSPREALDAGIATVYQDLAMIPLMAVWRNFFLGQELTKGWGPFRRFDSAQARRVTRQSLADMGIDIRDPDQPVGTLSGGERQSVAIARAVHFGARVLILDEPTSALGVRQAGVVLRYIAQARDRGVGVVFITHNPHHAFPVGDRFLLLGRGRSLGDFAKGAITQEEVTRLMAGGAELDQLAHELQRPTS